MALKTSQIIQAIVNAMAEEGYEPISINEDYLHFEKGEKNNGKNK